MAAKKKKRAAKKRAGRKPASVKVQNLAAATAASVRAVLGKGLARRPGVLAGILVDPAAVARLEMSPIALATAITKQTSISSGIKLKPGVIKGPGGILIGYQQAPVFAE